MLLLALDGRERSGQLVVGLRELLQLADVGERRSLRLLELLVCRAEVLGVLDLGLGRLRRRCLDGLGLFLLGQLGNLGTTLDRISPAFTAAITLVVAFAPISLASSRERVPMPSCFATWAEVFFSAISAPGAELLGRPAPLRHW
jgi:hypothetical protein